MCYGGGCDHPSHYAEGGNVNASVNPGNSLSHVKGVHKPIVSGSGMSNAGAHARTVGRIDKGEGGVKVSRERAKDNAVRNHVETLSDMSKMPKPNLMAEGGEMEDEESHPMVKRLMMSRGGIVSNEESGESTDEPTMAKADSNEFDDLALRDDLEGSYTGEKSGDEMGDSVESDDRKDIISRILKSRSKKDRMAVSGEGSTSGRRK